MKSWLGRFLFLLVIALIVVAWLVYFHNSVVASHMPKWVWVQKSITKLGQKVEVAAAGRRGSGQHQE